MPKRRRKDLGRKPPSREYRKVCWISAEGKTERDYFSMELFKRSPYAIKFPKDIHPNRRNPAAVLKRFQKALREEDFRKDDEAWLVVDVDSYDESELMQLVEWERNNARCHVAISNPKFELFLALHFAGVSGCTTPNAVDAELKKHLPQYKKRVDPRQFSIEEVLRACDRSEARRRGRNKPPIPAPGETDAYLLARKLLVGTMNNESAD